MHFFKTVKIVFDRIYSDYFMSSRLSEYENIIKQLVDSGYEFITLKEYCTKLKNNTLDNQKYLINRHDIDTDVSTAKEFFKIEKKYGVKGTYYFRLCTLDYQFMKELNEYGSEATYHFEEVAQYAKDNHIKQKEFIFENMDEIREIFKSNILEIENKLNTKIETVASHGDFVNRGLQIINNEITNDKKLREELGITCEAYDKELMESVDIYVADKMYPEMWAPKPIYEYIGKVDRIYMLTHPREWRVNIIENTVDNIKRFYEGIKW